MIFTVAILAQAIKFLVENKNYLYYFITMSNPIVIKFPYSVRSKFVDFKICNIYNTFKTTSELYSHIKKVCNITEITLYSETSVIKNNSSSIPQNITTIYVVIGYSIEYIVEELIKKSDNSISKEWLSNLIDVTYLLHMVLQYVYDNDSIYCYKKLSNITNYHRILASSSYKILLPTNIAIIVECPHNKSKTYTSLNAHDTIIMLKYIIYEDLNIDPKRQILKFRANNGKIHILENKNVFYYLFPRCTKDTKITINLILSTTKITSCDCSKICKLSIKLMNGITGYIIDITVINIDKLKTTVIPILQQHFSKDIFYQLLKDSVILDQNSTFYELNIADNDTIVFIKDTSPVFLFYEQSHDEIGWRAVPTLAYYTSSNKIYASLQKVPMSNNIIVNSNVIIYLKFENDKYIIECVSLYYNNILSSFDATQYLNSKLVKVYDFFGNKNGIIISDYYTLSIFKFDKEFNISFYRTIEIQYDNIEDYTILSHDDKDYIIGYNQSLTVFTPLQLDDTENISNIIFNQRFDYGIMKIIIAYNNNLLIVVFNKIYELSFPELSLTLIFEFDYAINYVTSSETDSKLVVYTNGNIYLYENNILYRCIENIITFIPRCISNVILKREIIYIFCDYGIYKIDFISNTVDCTLLETIQFRYYFVR